MTQPGPDDPIGRYVVPPAPPGVPPVPSGSTNRNACRDVTGANVDPGDARGTAIGHPRGPVRVGDGADSTGAWHGDGHVDRVHPRINVGRQPG